MSNTRASISLDDLLVEILSWITATLGSECAKDIVSTRICIFDKMNVAGKESGVFRQASLDEVPVTEGLGSKNLKVDAFIYNCAHHGITEAMYRQGVEEYFCKENFYLGMRLLTDAGDAHHYEAIYLFEMIYISKGPMECDQGNYSICALHFIYS
uniref:At2g35280-like TPR domain-containing protein n=1 Tax=Lactuca sativa TaxID=4236 RepID=A0A9R1XH31_LACSA|nr:hypothetical protein LSAT_V11C400182220 [Lactuca sativa]